MTIQETMQIGIPTGIMFISFTGIVMAISKQNEDKRKRIYERQDEIKALNNKEFVRKDVCKILHEQLQKDVGEIKDDVKELLRRNGGVKK